MNDVKPRVIVAISGGKASAWCADWALKNYPKEDVVLYFNDTKWEHEDLYRFLDDLSKYFDHPITIDSDGRTPEQLFYDNHALANNRMPFCSRVLKAERLHAFYNHGDTIIFGIGPDEPHRVNRVVGVYGAIASKTKKWPELKFPLLSENVTREQLDEFLVEAGIREPHLYTLGFTHNNCSGGCVRSGKGQWKLLYEKLPEVYAERERVEVEFEKHYGKKATFLKDVSLKELREKIELDKQFTDKQTSLFDDDEEDMPTECVGVCFSMS